MVHHNYGHNNRCRCSYCFCASFLVSDCHSRYHWQQLRTALVCCLVPVTPATIGSNCAPLSFATVCPDQNTPLSVTTMQQCITRKDTSTDKLQPHAGRHTPLFDLAISAWALLWSMIALIASCSRAAGLLIICGRSINTPTSITYKAAHATVYDSCWLKSRDSILVTNTMRHDPVNEGERCHAALSAVTTSTVAAEALVTIYEAAILIIA